MCLTSHVRSVTTTIYIARDIYSLHCLRILVLACCQGYGLGCGYVDVCITFNVGCITATIYFAYCAELIAPLVADCREMGCTVITTICKLTLNQTDVYVRITSDDALGLCCGLFCWIRNKFQFICRNAKSTTEYSVNARARLDFNDRVVAVVFRAVLRRGTSSRSCVCCKVTSAIEVTYDYRTTSCLFDEDLNLSAYISAKIITSEYLSSTIIIAP